MKTYLHIQFNFDTIILTRKWEQNKKNDILYFWKPKLNGKCNAKHKSFIPSYFCQ